MFQVMNKQLFPMASQVCYLDTAAEGLPPASTEAAMLAYLREKSRGTPGRVRLYEQHVETCEAAANLLRTAADNIALLANSSEALNLLANSIDWQPGDEVLISDLEFPSNVVVWLRLRNLGVRLVVIPSRDGIVRLEDWRSRLSSRTRVVSVSQVSYKTGTQLPYLSSLAEEAHSAGALFCVDATQALGRVPVSVQGVDYLVASSYKWLLGTHGLGVVYVAPELLERLHIATAGWYSVESVFHRRRFETFTPRRSAGRLQAGMPDFAAMFALNAGIDYLLSLGVERLDSTLRPLVRRLHEGLGEREIDLLTPAAPEFASGIVSFACEDPEQKAAWLAGQDIIVWGGDGRIRVSLHVYNDMDDVARCLEAIERMPGQLGTRVASSNQ
jgi:selenocysteine lyase/cysteine desulfurase